MLDFLATLLLVLLLAALLAVCALVALSFRRKARAEAAVPAIGAFVDIETAEGSGRIHALERGETRPDRHPIVLIHGAGGTLRHFSQTLVDPLAETDRVIAVDRPGAGYSIAPGPASMTLTGQAAALKQALDALGVEKPVLVGHSFGGSVALAYALDYPDAVSALVLLAPGVAPFKPKPPTSDAVIESAAMRAILAWTILGPTIEKARPAIQRVAFGPQSAPPDFSTAGGGALTVRPNQLRAAMEEQALYQPGLRAQATRYGALELPITVLFGDQDGILHPEEHGQRLAETAGSQVEIQLFPGVGHMLPYAIPDDVLAAIRAAAAKA